MSNASAEPKTTEAATTVKPTMVCPECGYRGKPMLVEGVPSCPKCGNDMQPMAAVPPAPAAKAGARHSKNDMALLTEIRDAARAIDADAVALGAEEQVEPPEPGEAPPAPSAKAGGVPAATDAPLIWGAVKAAGDWVLDVLGVPFGGPNGGKDTHGEFFTARTNLHLDKFTPIAVYYHGFTPDGKPQGDPEIIGKVETVQTKADGVWYRVVLNKASDYAKRVWAGAQKGIARASSGTIAHLRRVAGNGEILNWPVVELSLFDAAGDRQPANAYAVALPAAKAHYLKAGINLTVTDSEADSAAIGEQQRGVNGEASLNTQTYEEHEMDEKDIKALVADGVKSAFDAQRKAEAEAAKAKADADAEVAKQVEAGLKAAKAEWAKSNRLPFDVDGAPNVAQFGWMKKYQNVEPRDLALLVDILTPNIHLSYDKDYTRGPFSAIKALAIKLESSEGNSGTSDLTVPGIKAAVKLDNRYLYADALDALKASGIKANELDTNAQTGFGAEFVGVAYSTNLWEVIRQDASIGKKLMASAIEVPQGHDRIVLPLEGADMTWYKVPQTTAINATTGRPDATVTTSKLATASKTLVPAKMGARTVWAGELDEDSLVPWIANLRRQLELSGMEQFTHLVIDGDTQTSAANINTAAGTLSGNLFLLFDGFRKSPLVTTTANSRDAGGGLVAEDFINTVKLMGGAGVNALDRGKVSFIIDPNVMYKAVTLPEVKTRDVSALATIDNGALTGIYGYEVITSAFMHYASAKRMTLNTGKISATDTSNTFGAILAVRWDQWQLGYKRRVTVETQRFADADATQIVAQMRVDMVQRDTEASAISYDVGVA